MVEQMTRFMRDKSWLAGAVYDSIKRAVYEQELASRLSEDEQRLLTRTITETFFNEFYSGRRHYFE
jgi:hypothetical protein